MEGGNIRCWDQLIPDLLALIFNELSLEEKLTVIPRICKSWRKAVMEPLCWQEIDIEEWCYGPKLKPVDRMVQMLIGISGSPRKLCVLDLSNDVVFSYIADHAGSLQILDIPRSNISDSIVEEVAGRMCAITFLDLSHCHNIGVRALEAFGRNCRLLSTLKRNMHNSDPWVINNDEAHAIATTMSKLKHLEIRNMVLTTEGVLDILSGCQKLVYLDVRGCWKATLDDKFLNEKCSGLKVRRTCDDITYGFDPNFEEHWYYNQEEVEVEELCLYSFKGPSWYSS